VSLVEMATLLPKDDPELVQVVRQRLHDEGVAFHERTRVTAVESTSDGVALLTESDGNKARIDGSHLLVARRPLLTAHERTAPRPPPPPPTPPPPPAPPTSTAWISPPPASPTPLPASP